MSEHQPPCIEVRDVSKVFINALDLAGRIAQKCGAKLREEVVHAVDDVSLHIEQGEVVSLVGESGCGKSTLGRMIAGILKPTAGKILFHGKSITEMTGDQARNAALKVQMIFQNPFASLNPRMRVADIISEAPLVHHIIARKQKDDHLREVLLRCGLDPSFSQRYPHQFSGGQRQRIGIARALAVNPEFLVCDESVAALDVSIQAQILNLFMQLRKELNLTYLFISHDLSVVEHISDRIAIMYLGRIVESASTEVIFERANHPYTQALLKEVPRLENRKVDFAPITGEIPSPLDPPRGCHFHPRCPHAVERCSNERPELIKIAPGHMSACHLNEQATAPCLHQKRGSQC